MNSFRQIVLIALFPLSVFAGENHWTIKGPQAAQALKIVFDPADSSIVYAATTNGVFRSSDGGQHWTVGAGLLGIWFNDVAVVSDDPQKVFAASVFGLYKSSDRGATWSLVNGFPSLEVAVSANGSVVYSTAFGDVMRSSDGGVTFGESVRPAPYNLTALVIDPQNSDTVYAAFPSNAGVYKSTDGAAHWTAAKTGLTGLLSLSLLIDPSNGSVLYAASESHIYKTTNGAASWSELTDGLGGGVYRSLAISNAPSTIIAASDNGLYKSTNSGASWTGPSQPLLNSEVAIDPRNASNILLVSGSNVVRSTNGGSTFTPSASGLIAADTRSIAVDPRNESVVYTSGGAGIFKSTDFGENWSLLLGTFTQSIAVDPFNSQTLYAIISGNFMRSLNGGVVWEDFSTGLPETTILGPSKATHIRADSFTPGTLYTTIDGTPYKKVGAAAWTIKNIGLPLGPYGSFLEIDPHNSSVLYTGGVIGLYKSTDGGDSWTSAAKGLPSSGTSLFGTSAFAIDPFDSNHLLIKKSVAYESTNGGASWAPFPGTAGRLVGVFRFDPTKPGRIYNISGDTTERSDDGGKTWVLLSTGDTGGLFVISPSGNWLFNGSSYAGVWVFHYARRSRAVAH
jgi:photosystem II stability/assembly factor-like uncharacterized protein